MQLTEKNKQYIDSLDYEQLLSKWRFAPVGSQWFQGETGDYWKNRMTSMKQEEGGQDRHVEASKHIGW